MPFSSTVERLHVLAPMQADHPTLSQVREWLQGDVQYLQCNLAGAQWELGSCYLMRDPSDAERILFVNHGQPLVEGELTEDESGLQVITESMLVG